MEKNNIMEDKQNNKNQNNSYIYTQTFDNKNLLDYVKNRINEFKKVNWNKYLKKNIIYFVITTIEDPDLSNRIFCMIGYSSDLIETYNELENTFNCKLYLIGLKLVKNINDYEEFDSIATTNFPELSIKLKTNNQNYKHNRIFVFDIELYNFFCNWEDRDEFDKKAIELEESTERMINELYGKY